MDSLIKNQVMPEIEAQLQGLVDGMIDMELANLRLKFGIKKRKEKKSKKKKKKKKKGKPMPGSKSCKNRDPRDMLAELVEAGIVKKLMPANIDDLVGYPNLLRGKQESLMQTAPDPSMFDIRQAVREFIGMPLGSTYLKEKLDRMN